MTAAGISFRHATAADLPDIVSMLADDVLGRQREAPSIPLNRKYLEAFAAMDVDPNQVLAVAELDGDIAGCLQLTFIPGLSRLGMLRGQIESVRVASGYRGNGVGRMMFAWAIEECRKKGCGLVQLTTDKSRGSTRQFYEPLGFEATHEGMKLSL